MSYLQEAAAAKQAKKDARAARQQQAPAQAAKATANVVPAAAPAQLKPAVPVVAGKVQGVIRSSGKWSKK